MITKNQRQRNLTVADFFKKDFHFVFEFRTEVKFYCVVCSFSKVQIVSVCCESCPESI